MRKFIRTYSLFFVVVFLTAIGLKSTHFLQHTSDHAHCSHHHDDCDDHQEADCDLCEFTLFHFTDTNQEVFTPVNWFIDYHYRDFGVTINFKNAILFIFSLRAPPSFNVLL
ncbi:MAG: hypothetical protein Q4B43_06830 [Bacteroidota bacterium]|nr:hypothetical protein [Bacteroidota bacterium]